MLLALTEDQVMLANVASEFAAEQAPIKRSRTLRAGHASTGYDPQIWRNMAELGWVGIPFPEELGGLGLGLTEVAIILEQLGRTLAPEPFISSVLLGGIAVAKGDNRDLQKSLIPALCAGELTLAMAHEESRLYNGAAVSALTAKPDGAGGWLLNGVKHRVLDGLTANGFVISAKTDDGTALLYVPADTQGLEVVGHSRVDSRNAATVTLSDARVGGDKVICSARRGEEVLEQVLDGAIAGLCAEMVGLTSAAFELTLEHLRTRHQFDVPLGSFQALQHRAANCFAELELARSSAMAATRAIEEDAANAKAIVSAAKARCSDTAILVTNEGVQLHGGMGITDECDIGLFLKRGRAAAMTFGDSTYHRDRFASLSGF